MDAAPNFGALTLNDDSPIGQVEVDERDPSYFVQDLSDPGMSTVPEETAPPPNTPPQGDMPLVSDDSDPFGGTPDPNQSGPRTDPRDKRKGWLWLALLVILFAIVAKWNKA